MTSSSATQLERASVCVLMGGTSSERAVSLKTGAAIVKALLENDGRGPLRVQEIEIEADGRWTIGGETHDALTVLERTPREALWFLALHGGAGEDGTIQGLLRSLGRVHTGSGVGASALCMSKTWTREVLRAAGLAVAPALVVEAHVWRENRNALLERATRLGVQGFAVKPDRGGSSVATFLVEEASGLPDAIARVLATGDAALVEARIVGAEATCGVLGRQGGALRVLTPVEIVPKDGRFFDYEEKYNADGAQEFCPPRTISSTTSKRIQELALRAFRAAHCDGYARIDFMIPRNEHEAEGDPIVLEINTLPGMTDRSLLPLAAREGGLSFRDLCLEILRLARNDVDL
ncbi:MAG: D-alanine--D-alanine ligase [Planctomycetota bacterium]|nr:D-alanine--D-alanine ligase [Planctomycetota bacterium]